MEGLQGDRSDPEDRKRRAGFGGGLDKGRIYTSYHNVVCMQIRSANIDQSDYVLCIYAWSLTHSCHLHCNEIIFLHGL